MKNNVCCSKICGKQCFEIINEWPLYSTALLVVKLRHTKPRYPTPGHSNLLSVLYEDTKHFNVTVTMHKYCYLSLGRHMMKDTRMASTQGKK